MVKVLVKVDFSGLFRNYSRQIHITNDVKFKRVLFNAILGQMELNSDHYDQMVPSYFIFYYIILDTEGSNLLLKDTLLKIDEGMLSNPIDLPLQYIFENLEDKEKKLFHSNGSIKINDYSFCLIIWI